MTGPGDKTTAVEDGQLRASHDDREQVIGILKAAFVEGRLTEDELDARADQVYASRTYGELAKVTADIPVKLTRAQPPRDPWRATKVAWKVVYALIVPGIVTLIAMPGGPAPLTVSKVVILSAVVYAVCWIIGISVMVASRLGKQPSGKQPSGKQP